LISDAIVERVLGLTGQIQQIPAPTFGEGARAEFLKTCFEQEKLLDIEIDRLGNVLGRYPGTDPKSPIIVSAHLDTVFPLETDLTLRETVDRISGPGIGDNSVGLAGLLGLIWAIKDSRIVLASDLWLVANVGEEGLGDLSGAKEVVNRFADNPKAYLVLEGMALGQVYHRGLGVERYRIRVETDGGHSWVDYGKPSAVHELAAVVTRLLDIPISEIPRTIMNAGVISGGTTVNTIASEAHVELDLRSENPEVLGQLVNAVMDAVQGFQKSSVRVNVDLIGRRPAGSIPQDHPLVTLASECLETLGIQPRLNIGSTDANIPLSLGYPAVCLGLTTGNGAHTTGEYINTPPLKLGLEQLLLLVKGLGTG
jgi:acetylornithine deacetylase/succinyl-diaminopimelate desuccinylase-like protein